MATGSELIRVENVTKKFKGGVTALNECSLTIARGEVVAIIGPSGSGKSTLLRCLNLLETPTSGHIYFGGVDITDKKVDINLHRRKMGMVFQHFNLFPHKKVLENLTISPILVKKADKAAAKAKAVELLERVGLADRADAYPSQLSGGQKQRVAIARALMRRPALLLADEPVASLDPVTGRQILALLQDIQRTEGIAFLMNSHNLDQSRAVSTRLLGLHAGRIVLDSVPAAVTDADLARIYGGAESEAAP